MGFDSGSADVTPDSSLCGYREKEMIKKIALIVSFTALLFVTNLYGEEIKYKDYKGVVTFHLIPAKVIKVNKIIENPKPGTSYIGDDGILVEIDENIDMMANWTVVKFRYYQYDEPKSITYKIFSEEKESTVRYHAVDLKVDGDLSSYIKQ